MIGHVQEGSAISAPEKNQARLQRDRKRLQEEHDAEKYGKPCKPPSMNLPFPPGNLTAVEILVFFPQWLRSWDIIERLCSNNGTPILMVGIINKHRVKTRGFLSVPQVCNTMKRETKYLEDERYKQWSVSRHEAPEDWDETNLNVHGFRTPNQIRIHGGKRAAWLNKKPLAIPFKELAQGVKQLPVGDDALDLTACIQWHLDNPEEQAWYPNDFQKIVSKLGGPTLVKPENFDKAVFQRYRIRRASEKQALRKKVCEDIRRKKQLQSPKTVPQKETICRKRKHEAVNIQEKEFDLSRGRSHFDGDNVGQDDNALDKYSYDEASDDEAYGWKPKLGRTQKLRTTQHFSSIEEMPDEHPNKRVRCANHKQLTQETTRLSCDSEWSRHDDWGTQTATTSRQNPTTPSFVQFPIEPFVNPILGVSPDRVHWKYIEAGLWYQASMTASPHYFNAQGDRYLRTYPDPPATDFSDAAENIRWMKRSIYVKRNWTDAFTDFDLACTERSQEGFFSHELLEFTLTGASPQNNAFMF